MRVLVVDDDAAVRDSLARTLRFEGHEVDTARDGLEALAMVRAGEPDAVILDVSMPAMDGLEACRRLRADAIRDGRPQSCTKPLARVWSKVSPVS